MAVARHASRRIYFYSHRGGTGRTTLLINSAVALAQMGHRVCVFDFDFSAPGLSRWSALAGQDSVELSRHVSLVSMSGSPDVPRRSSPLSQLIRLKRVKAVETGLQTSTRGVTRSELQAGGLWVAALDFVTQGFVDVLRMDLGWPLVPEVEPYESLIDEIEASVRPDIVLVDFSPGLGFGHDLLLQMAGRDGGRSLVVCPTRITTQSAESMVLANAINEYVKTVSRVPEPDSETDVQRVMPVLTFVPGVFAASMEFARRRRLIEEVAFGSMYGFECIIPLIVELSISEETLTAAPRGFLLDAEPYWHTVDVILSKHPSQEEVGSSVRICSTLRRPFEQPSWSYDAGWQCLAWWLVERADEMFVEKSASSDPRRAQSVLLALLGTIDTTEHVSHFDKRALISQLIGGVDDFPRLPPGDLAWLKNALKSGAEDSPATDDADIWESIRRHCAQERGHLVKLLRELLVDNASSCRRALQKFPKTNARVLDDCLPILASSTGDYREQWLEVALAFDDVIFVVTPPKNQPTSEDDDVRDVAEKLQRAASFAAGKARRLPSFVVVRRAVDPEGWVNVYTNELVLESTLNDQPYANRFLFVLSADRAFDAEAAARMDRQRSHPGNRVVRVATSFDPEWQQNSYLLTPGLEDGLRRWRDDLRCVIPRPTPGLDVPDNTLVHVRVENQAPGRALTDVLSAGDSSRFQAFTLDTHLLSFARLHDELGSEIEEPEVQKPRSGIVLSITNHDLAALKSATVRYLFSVNTGFLAYARGVEQDVDKDRNYVNWAGHGANFLPPRTFYELLEKVTYLHWAMNGKNTGFLPLALQHGCQFPKQVDGKAAEFEHLTRVEQLVFWTQWSMLSRMLVGPSATGTSTWREELLKPGGRLEGKAIRRFLMLDLFGHPRGQEAPFPGLDWNIVRGRLETHQCGFALCWNDTAELFGVSASPRRGYERDVGFNLFCGNPEGDDNRIPTPQIDGLIMWMDKEGSLEETVLTQIVDRLQNEQRAGELLVRGAAPVDWLVASDNVGKRFENLERHAQLSMCALRYGVPHGSERRKGPRKPVVEQARGAFESLNRLVIRLTSEGRSIPSFETKQLFDDWYWRLARPLLIEDDASDPVESILSLTESK